MIEILLVAIFCNGLAEAARERKRNSTPWVLSFVFVYLACEALGAILAMVLRLPGSPIWGAYLFGVPLAVCLYFVLKAKVRRLPMPPPAAPSGPQISFLCTHCGTSRVAFASQRGWVVKCGACMKPIMGPSGPPSPRQQVASGDSSSN